MSQAYSTLAFGNGQSCSERNNKFRAPPARPQQRQPQAQTARTQCGPQCLNRARNSQGTNPKTGGRQPENWPRGVCKARELKKGAQASQSVFLSPDQVLQATSKERWTPGLLEARTMRKDSLAFSHVRSGSLAAGSYFLMHQRRQLLSAWAAYAYWCRKSLLCTSWPPRKQRLQPTPK